MLGGIATRKDLLRNECQSSDWDPDAASTLKLNPMENEKRGSLPGLLRFSTIGISR